MIVLVVVALTLTFMGLRLRHYRRHLDATVTELRRRRNLPPE